MGLSYGGEWGGWCRRYRALSIGGSSSGGVAPTVVGISGGREFVAGIIVGEGPAFSSVNRSGGGVRGGHIS